MVTSTKGRLAAVAVAAGFALLYWQVFAKLVLRLDHDDNYSHGFLIVPLALYFAWERRDAAADAVTQADSVRSAWSSPAASRVLLAGILGSELFLTRISIARRRWPASIAVPVRLAAPADPGLPARVPAADDSASGDHLQPDRVSAAAARVARRRGRDQRWPTFPVLREGNVLILANTTLEVAEACSGIRSLVSLLTLGIVLGYFTDRAAAGSGSLIALSTIPVAIVANGAARRRHRHRRARFRAAAAEGFFHEFSGWVVFVVAFALMLGSSS